MKWSELAAVSCAALLFAAMDEAAAGGRSSGRSSSGSSRSHSGHPQHRHHFHSRVFIGVPFFWGPSIYYAPAYYYPAPAPVYIEQDAAPLDESSQYWYYCPSSGAYYPYVGDCPGGWQRVLPHPNPQPSAG